MDYNELVEKLNDLEASAYGYNVHGEVFGMDCVDFEQIMVDAATAITELLARAEKTEAERDEAVGHLSDFPNPRTCKNSDRCEHISVVTGRPYCRGCEEWEWNGGREE